MNSNVFLKRILIKRIKIILKEAAIFLRSKMSEMDQLKREI